MKYYFWNSLTNAGGYKAVELVDGEIKQIKLPSYIDAELSNGACQVMLRTSMDNNQCFLIVKGLKYNDSERKFDAQGRDVNINLVLESGINGYEKLARISVGFLMEWDNCRRFLGELIESSNTDLCYNINQKRYELLLGHLASFPLTAECNGKDIRINTKSSHSLLVLSTGSSKDYYRTMRSTLYSAFKLSNDYNDAWSVVINSNDFAIQIKNSQTCGYNDFENAVLAISSTSIDTNTDITINEREAHSFDYNELFNKAKMWFVQLPPFLKYLLVFLIGLWLGSTFLSNK